MNPATHELLNKLGFHCRGIDPEARDHQLYAPLINVGPVISIPTAGCSGPDVAHIIFHAGSSAARKEIASAHQAFLRSLAVS